MSVVTEKQQTDFQTLGFALVKDVIAPDQLTELHENLADLWQRAKKKQINSIRVYDDFPYFLGGTNVAGIEDALFHAPLLKDWLITSGLDKNLAALTGWRGAQLELARIHVNDRFKYQGFWHRDAKVRDAEKSVVAIVYFKDEEGFRIAPAASKYSSANLPIGDEIQSQYCYDPLDGEHLISAPAGSVFFMKSYLLHRGYNNKPRMHLHMRFIESDDYDVSTWARYRNVDAPPYNFAASSPMARARTLISYCIPRQNRSSLFQK